MHGMNLQVIASPESTILWVSGELPGSAHDTAARIWQSLAALCDAGLVALGDKGYHGYDETGQLVLTPYKGRDKPESQKDANLAAAAGRQPGESAQTGGYWLTTPSGQPVHRLAMRPPARRCATALLACGSMLSSPQYPGRATPGVPTVLRPAGTPRPRHAGTRH